MTITLPTQARAETTEEHMAAMIDLILLKGRSSRLI
jgi:hypothetical protein